MRNLRHSSISIGLALLYAPKSVQGVQMYSYEPREPNHLFKLAITFEFKLKSFIKLLQILLWTLGHTIYKSRQLMNSSFP